jgi:TolA-binding protein
VQWIEEGNQILSQIRTLEDLKDRALTEAPETLARIESLRDQFIQLLKTVERARIAHMSPQGLQDLRRSYIAERERQIQVLDEERKALIARAEAFRQTIDTNEFLTRHPQRAQVLEDFLYRLAELYYQDAGAEFLKAFDRWNQQVEEARAAGQTVPVAPKPDYSRAMEVYQTILDDYPYGKHMDACLFNLAKIYESQGDSASNEKAIDYYRRLARSFPDSPYIAKVYLGIGDYYFFQENVQPELLDANMRNSINAYQKVLSTPDTALYNDAYFKIGWAFYRIDQFADAVDAFTNCVDNTLELKDKEDPSEVASFFQNSIRYLALCFTSEQWEKAGLENAADYIQADENRRNTYGEAVIRQIGEIHADLYEWSLAIAAYDLYLNLYPLNRYAVDVNEQKIVAMEQAGLRTVEERNQFLTLYGPGSKWRAANPDSALAARVDSKRENFLFRSTDEITTRAVQSSDPQALEEAIQFCQRFLETFPKSDRAPQVRMNLAMMLYNPPIQRYLDAYDQFLYICWHYTDDMQRRETAAKNAVAAAFAITEAEQQGTQTFTPELRADLLQKVIIHSDFDSLYPNWQADLTTGEVLYCQALDTYLAIFPVGDFAPECLWRVGRLFFDHQKYAMSRYWLVQIEARFADLTKDVEESNKLILNGYILEKDYAGIEARSQHILQLNIDPEFRESVRVRLAEAIFQSAEALKEKADQTGLAVDHQAAGLEFKRCALEIPDFEYADASLFNAGLEFTEAKEYEAAVSSYQLLEEKYPKSEYMERALYNHAYVLGADLQKYEEAAEVNMRLFNEYPKSTLRSNALYNASQSYLQAGNTEKAIKANQTFAATYPGSAEAKSLLLGAALLLGQSDDKAGASQMFGEFADKYPDDPNAVRAHYERGSYLMKQGDSQGARREFQKAVDTYKQLSNKGVEGIGDVRPLASKSLNTILNWDFQIYEDIKLEPHARLAAQIAEKKRLSEILMQGYDQLIAWSEAEAIRAMVRRAEVLEEYAASFRDQAPPTDRNAADRGEKIVQIARDAVGYQELAIEEYQKVLSALPKARTGLEERLRTATDEEKPALDTLIASVAQQASYCQNKIPDLRLSTADYLNATLQQMLGPGAYSNLGMQSRLKRQFTMWNSDLFPLVVEVLDLYHLAALTADSAYGQGNERSRKAQEGTLSAVNAYVDYGENLTRSALTSYRGAIGDYGNVLPRGDGAKLKGLEAGDYAALADDFNKKANIYAQATIGTGEDLIDRLDQYGFAKTQTGSLEDIITSFVVEYSDLCEQHALDAEKGLAASKAGYEEQQTVVYEDAQFVFGQWVLVWSQYQLEILKLGNQFVEKFSIISPQADQIMEKLSTLEPGTYGTSSSDSPER